MAEIRKVKIDKEFIVKIKGEVETDMTDEKIKWSLDTMDKELESIIREEIIEDSEISVEPVKHGEWTKEVSGIWHCSKCLHTALLDGGEEYVLSEFCPRCGAKMNNNS